MNLQNKSLDDDSLNQASRPEASRYLVYINERLRASLDDGKYNEFRASFYRVCRDLASRGTSVYQKSCRGNGNERWKRTPLSGRGKFNHYLWWTLLEGEERHEEKRLEFVVQEIREHDDHTHLALSAERSVLSPTILCDANVAGNWSREQERAISCTDRVRLIRGYPGTGKTMVLYESICRRPGARALFVTGTEDLEQDAREYFYSFRPENVMVEVYSYRKLIADIIGGGTKPVTSREIESGREGFLGACKRAQNKDLGIWKKYSNSLLDECAAHLIGKLPPISEWPDYPVLSGTFFDDYLAKRVQRRDRPEDRVTDGAARALRRIARSNSLVEWFPLQRASLEAERSLESGTDSDLSRFLSFDQIVVDEIQDYTEVDLRFLLKLASRQSGTAAGEKPCVLVMGGDESQTVTASDFHWAALKRQVEEILREKPRVLHLEENQRSAEALARLVHYTQRLEQSIAKEQRPRVVKPARAARDVQGEIVRVVPAEGRSIGEALETAVKKNLRIVDPCKELQVGTSEGFNTQTLGPQEVKGLSYPEIGVVGLDRALASARPRDAAARVWDPRDGEYRRRVIDSVRVALSRATDKLFIFEGESSPSGRDTIGEFLECAKVTGSVRIVRASLLQREIDDVTVYEVLRERLKLAKSLCQGSTEAAWDSARQVICDATTADDVDLTKSEKDEVLSVALAIGLRYLEDCAAGEEEEGVWKVVDGFAAGLSDLSKYELAAVKRMREGSEEDRIEATFELVRYLDASAQDHADLLEALRRHTVLARQFYRERLLALTDVAVAHVSRVRDLYRACGDGDPESSARNLLRKAVEAAEAGQDYRLALCLAGAHGHLDDAVVGRLAEMAGDHCRAARAFARGGDGMRAVRNARLSGDVDFALGDEIRPLLEPSEESVLQNLRRVSSVEFERLLPRAILTRGEKEWLKSRIVQVIEKLPVDGEQSEDACYPA